MATKGYTTTTKVAAQLGRTLTAQQIAYLESSIIPAAEEWVDSVGGRTYGESSVVAEQLYFSGGPYTWLSKAPVTTLERVRGWLWGQAAADIQALNDVYYSLVDPRTGYLYLPAWAQYEYLEADYTPDATIPERIKLATTMVCCVYMRTVLHPQTEWLSEYGSGQDVRLKFRDAVIPDTVYDLIGSSGGGYVVA